MYLSFNLEMSSPSPSRQDQPFDNVNQLHVTPARSLSTSQSTSDSDSVPYTCALQRRLERNASDNWYVPVFLSL